MTNEFVYAVSSLLCATTSAAYDVTSHKIPNFLTLPAIAAGLLIHLVLGGWRQLLGAFAAGLMCGLIFLVFYLSGGMGAGDVKLITAIGCISGLSLVGSQLIFTSLAGGAMALGLALYHDRLRETVRNVLTILVHHGTDGLKPHPQLNIGNTETLRLPYALAITAGTALTLCFMIIVRGIR